ncbi:MAG: metal ABC transporter permease [Simkaniaceae bacterium]|nr:metal ABC transporter permease [Simkaniaceae bacterium]
MLISYFLFMALGIATAASIVSGIIGSYVVVKRIVFISGSIAHSVLGGMGLFLYIGRVYHIPWLYPIYGALVFALISSFLIGYIHINYRQREDTVIASLWAFGMALGVIFVSITPGYTIELMQFLFGNLLWTSSSDLYLLLGLDVLIILIIALFHKRFQAICFDEEQAYLQGLHVKRLYMWMLTLIAITVVILIKIIGAILVVAMLCLPAATAGLFCSRLSKMIVLAIILSALFSCIGITLSYTFNWPPGASIALTSTVIYFLSLAKNRRHGSTHR